MGGKERSDGVKIFLAENWVDSAVSIERHNKRILIIKMVLDSGILNVFTQESQMRKKKTFEMNYSIW